MLKELNSKLTVEITKLRKKYAKEQDRKNKTDISNLINENTKLKSRILKLEQKLSQNNEEKDDLIAKLDDNTASYKMNSDNTSEQIENISDNISNSDIYKESNIQYSELFICTESESSKNKQIKFLNKVYKETVSNEISERNKEKKFQAQNSLSYDKDNSLYNFKSKVAEIQHETGVTDKTAITQIYKKMLKHLSSIIPVALRIKTLRAKKIHKLFGENKVGMDKINTLAKLLTSSSSSSKKLPDVKQYPYLFLHHSDEFNDCYEFNDSGICTGCEQKHSKRHVFGIANQCIYGFYYIKCQNLPYEKEIKMSISFTSQVLDFSDSKKLPELLIKNESNIDTLILLLQQRFKISQKKLEQ
ncbi:10467_t:CDS:2 [Cetraspora pellucida]|uniref:10467_t:CDS:1 n=1 Tax=Cetraspora pellucida TaxID=1433469 RepID=A0ACA9MFR4_9GLOM|nr:10467_t:CDS:2 [Cetraspora pellucida]